MVPGIQWRGLKILAFRWFYFDVNVTFDEDFEDAQVPAPGCQVNGVSTFEIALRFGPGGQQMLQNGRVSQVGGDMARGNTRVAADRVNIRAFV